jgi:TRAP-type mannitol/chloroaromatic compound transport system substrate-binding protein
MAIVLSWAKISKKERKIIVVKKRSMAVVLITIMAVLAFTLTAGEASDLPTLNWRWVSTWGEGNTHLSIDRRFAEVLSELTGGRFNITVFPAGQLGADNQVLDMVSDGTVEAGGDWAGYWSGRNTGFDLLGTTMFNFSKMDYFIWIFQAGGLEDAYNYIYNKFNVKYFPILVHSSESGFRGTIPIKGIGDLAGLRIRLAGRIQGIVAQQLGFTPVMISSLEIYESLQRGVIDAGEFSVPIADYSLRLHEAAHHWWSPGWHQSAGVNGALVNMDQWNALPPAYQRAFENAAKITLLESMTRYSWADFVVVREMLEDYNVEVSFYPDADLDHIFTLVRAAMDQMANDNPDYKVVMDSMLRYRWYADPYRDLLGRFGYGFSFNEFDFQNRYQNPEKWRSADLERLRF